ncbi:MAG: hypothetical protein K1X95_03205 [Acidimicrobiia bacterium]|nr:hypothetical protein [Acidimicrobiia bacterium]
MWAVGRVRTGSTGSAACRGGRPRAAKGARCLEELPLIAAESAAGRLSYSKVRALTRVATAGDEADLVDFARDAPTAMLERFVRAYRGAFARGDDAAVAAYEGRRLTWRTDYDDGSLVVTTRLAPEDGAAFLAALGAAREALAGTGDVSAETCHSHRALSNVDGSACLQEPT